MAAVLGWHQETKFIGMVGLLWPYNAYFQTGTAYTVRQNKLSQYSAMG